MLESKSFLDTISLFATGVTVITAYDGTREHGMTANAFTSLSLSPMQIIFCLAKKAKMTQIITIGSPFTINFLREEQEAISNHFAGNWKQEKTPEFRFVKWEGGPRIEGCLACVGCEAAEIADGGDHWIVIGKVVSVLQGIEPRKPLLYFNRKYHCAEPTGTAAPDRLDLGGTDDVQMFYDPW